MPGAVRVKQPAGVAFVSSLPHSVTGVSLLHVSHNVAFADKIEGYLSAALQMAERYRMAGKMPPNVGSAVLATRLCRTYFTEYSMGRPAPGWMSSACALLYEDEVAHNRPDEALCNVKACERAEDSMYDLACASCSRPLYCKAYKMGADDDYSCLQCVYDNLVKDKRLKLEGDKVKFVKKQLSIMCYDMMDSLSALRSRLCELKPGAATFPESKKAKLV